MVDAARTAWELAQAPAPAARVHLRLPVDADAPALLAVFGDPEVMRYWSARPMQGLDEARALVARSHTGFEQGQALQWAIGRRDDDLAIGTVTLFELHGEQGRGSLGYALGRAHWGLGLAREAVSLALDVAFGVLGLRRIEADTDPRNLASARLLSALGFQLEGTLRERWYVHGEIQDSAIYGMLAREWRP